MPKPSHILLTTSILLVLASCRGKVLGKNDRTDRETKTQQLSGGKDISISAPEDLKELAGQLQIGDGASLNTQTLGASMGIGNRVEGAGPAVNIQSSKSASAADYSRLSIEIPYSEGSSLRLADLFLVIAYAVTGEDGLTKVGIIPATGNNAYKIVGNKLRFNLRGFGNYQALRIPVEIKEEKSAKSDLVTTKSKEQVANFDCTQLLEEPYCINLKNLQIASVRDLVINEDKILSSESRFKISWKMPDKTEGILGTKVMLASDQSCTKEVKGAELDLKEQSYQFTDIKNGAYFGCVFAKSRAAGLLPAKNNGIKIAVEAAAANALNDTTKPTAPSAISVPSFSKATSVSATYTAGTDANFSTHNVKACTSTDCSTGCLSVSQDVASPVTVGSLVNDTAYYICMQSVDLAGNTSAYVAAPTRVKIDTTAPTAPSSLGFSGSFGTSTSLSLAFAIGTDSNFSTHEARLCTSSNCSTGCGSSLQSATSPISLTGTAGTVYYGCARSLDLAGNSSSLVASIGTMTIDNTSPTAPAAVTVPGSGGASVSVTYTAGTDLNFTTHNVKACTASNCTSSCLSSTQDVASPVTVSGLADTATYWICIQSVDQANNTSAYVASGNSVTISTTPPNAPSGITWSTAYSNITSYSLAWTNGSGTFFSTHNLKACTDAGCSTSCTTITQDAASPGSLSGMVAGSTYYACLQSVDTLSNTSAYVASTGTVAVDTTNPTAPSAITVPTYNNTTSVNVTYTAGADANFSTHNVKACTASDCTTGCLSTIQDPASPVTVASLVTGTSYYICMQSVDLAANVSAYVPSGNAVMIDTTIPAVPAAITWAGAYTSALSWTNGSDTNFSTHNLKACTDTGCSTSCAAVTQDTTTPGSISGMSAGPSYYACVQTVDLAGNTSAYVASAGTTAIDTTNPTAPSAITVPTYSNATSVNVTYTAGTDANFSTHNVKACTASDCTTGCLSTIQDPASPVTVASLVSGTAYYICMQSVDLAANLSAYVASGNSVTIDTTNPAAPASIAWAGAYSSSTTASLTWTNGGDINFSTHNLKACTNTACSTACTSVTQDSASPGSISGMVAGSTYYACVQSVDLAGNISAYVASAGTTTIDTTAPGAPTAVTVPTYGNTNFNITFTAGAETNPAIFNIKACTTGCTTGCVGSTTTVASPGTISGAALTNGNGYRGCVQGVDLAGNTSVFVQSAGLLIFDTTTPSAPSSLSVPAYSNSTSVNATFSVGTDAYMSTHNFKACTMNNCSTGCLSTIQTATSPAALTGLVNGTAYYACGQAVDLAGNVSSFSFTPATVIIDTTAPTSPSAVSVPTNSATSFAITFTGGTELNPAAYNIKACTNSGCSTGCVGATTTASSPGTIASAALSNGTSYYGCVQGADLAGNTSAFVASAGTVLYNSFAVTYNGNGSTGGSVPTDATAYASGATATVLGVGALIRAGYSLNNWNTAANGSGTSYSAAQIFSIAANTTLYAQWTVVCTSLSGGTYVMVPGDSIYGTSSFCVQKYAASNVGSVATAQTGTLPWVNINQTDSIAKCASFGPGYHLITNPEWMTISANLANVGSNWSTSAVGSGTLRRGHSDTNPNNACAADASDANAYVETTCTGTSSGTFVERRTSTLSNGAVVWDIGGNVWNWVNYNNSADKPTPATSTFYEYIAITGSTTTPKAHLVPLYSAQSWWTDSWGSAQGSGQIYPGTNGPGGALLRGASWGGSVSAGAFSVFLNYAPSSVDPAIGLRCAYTPLTFALTYDANTATGGIPPNDPTLYASGSTATVKNNPMALVKTSNTFAGWNTLANGTGTNYTPGGTFTISANTILYARWINCSALAGGTWVQVPGDSIYGTTGFCVQKYAPSNVSSVPTSQTGTTPWVSISQTTAISTCASLGTGYHLITNPEWMTIAANLANVGSNWSTGTVGGAGTLRRGHSDNNPASACAADASDANAYVETTCTGTSSGTFVERRTSTLSNGTIVWDIGGNVWNWVNYTNSSDKPTPATGAWYEYTAITGSTATPKSHLVPLNSAQSWWTDSWNSTQGIGQLFPGTNGSGGTLLRGVGWNGGASAGPFAVDLSNSSSFTNASFGFRCTWQP